MLEPGLSLFPDKSIVHHSNEQTSTPSNGQPPFPVAPIQTHFNLHHLLALLHPIPLSFGCFLSHCLHEDCIAYNPEPPFNQPLHSFKAIPMSAKALIGSPNADIAETFEHLLSAHQLHSIPLLHPPDQSFLYQTHQPLAFIPLFILLPKHLKTPTQRVHHTALHLKVPFLLPLPSVKKIVNVFHQIEHILQLHNRLFHLLLLMALWKRNQIADIPHFFILKNFNKNNYEKAECQPSNKSTSALPPPLCLSIYQTPLNSSSTSVSLLLPSRCPV